MAAPAHAAAATVVGSDFSGAGVGSSSSAERLFIQDAIADAAIETPAGVITRWGLQGATGTFALEVFRHRSGESLVTGEIHADFVAQSEVRTAGPGQQSFATRIPVDAGDYIALHAGAGAGVIVRNAPGEQTWYFQAPPDATSVDQDQSTRVFSEVFYQAVVEPDADRDGYGDETQDGCPSNASTRGACPATTPPPRPTPPTPVDPYAAVRASGPTVKIARAAQATRRGRVTFTLTNPYAFALRGKLRVSYGRKRLATRSVALRAGATVKVRTRLRGRALRALRRRGRVRLKLAATVKAPAGKGRTTRAGVTAKLPARKRRRRAPNGGGGGSIPEGTYNGSYTSQMSAAPGSSPLSFRVVGGQVVEFATRVHVACSGAGVGFAIEDFKPVGSVAITPDGTFSGRFEDRADGETFTYDGKINTDGTASGKLRYVDFDYGFSPSICNGAGAWTARR